LKKQVMFSAFSSLLDLDFADLIKYHLFIAYMMIFYTIMLAGFAKGLIIF